MIQEDIEKRLRNLIDHVNESAASVQNNEVPVLGPWEEEAVKICADIEKSAPEVAKALEQQVLEMIISLEKLSIELESFQNRLEEKNGETE